MTNTTTHETDRSGPRQPDEYVAETMHCDGVYAELRCKDTPEWIESRIAFAHSKEELERAPGWDLDQIAAIRKYAEIVDELAFLQNMASGTEERELNRQCTERDIGFWYSDERIERYEAAWSEAISTRST